MINRYSRILELNDISETDLSSLKKKNVLLIGVGGVGEHVATYLLTNGVVNLTLADYDEVEISNLNRQILLTENDIGKNKVDVVKKALLTKNSDAHIKTLNLKIDENNISSIINDYDLVIDAVDNWETKLAIAKEANAKNIPFLHIGVDGYKGQFCLFKNKTLNDIVPKDIVNSPKDGVLGPMVGLISSYASMLAIHYLLGKNIESDTLFHFDYFLTRLTKIKL